MLRAFGTIPLWIAASLALSILPSQTLGRGRRAGSLVLAATLATALLAEALKIVVGLERPILHDGSLVFRPLAERWHSGGLSFPSSHAAVAFGGAAMMWMLHAPGRTLAMLAAVGCAATRVMVGAHFLSDVVGSAILAAIVTAALLRALPRRADHPANYASAPPQTEDLLNAA